MKIVISPAKSLNWDPVNLPMEVSQPVFLEEAIKVNGNLKKLSRKKLKELQGISVALADLNWQRNQDWSPNEDLALTKAAMFAFNGEVYTGLDALSMNEQTLLSAQKNLRSLSGLYGILKPLDAIMPYRLEMGTKIKVRRSANLYEFWKNKVTQSLLDEMGEGEHLINLASNEYFKVLDAKKLEGRVIDVSFLDWSNGKHKVLSFFAKKARGSMARFILEKELHDPEQLKMFETDGYYFDEKRSNSNNLVFLNDRKK